MEMVSIRRLLTGCSHITLGILRMPCRVLGNEEVEEHLIAISERD